MKNGKNLMIKEKRKEDRLRKKKRFIKKKKKKKKKKKVGIYIQRKNNDVTVFFSFYDFDLYFSMIISIHYYLN